MKNLVLLLAALALFASCKNKKQPEQAQLTIKNTVWELVAFDGESITYPEGSKKADMLLEEGTNKVSGFSACNRYFGSYECDGVKAIKFSQMGMTRMACMETGEIESKLMKAFEQANTFKVEDDTLYLQDGERVLAAFKTVAD